MNEFIVWDKLNKEFLTTGFSINPLGGCYNTRDIKMDCSLHNYIGKKDINNNKIYADCSIVEFLRLGVWKGFFYFDKSLLSYRIKTFQKENGVASRFFNFNQEIKHIKIIDTIQQNKLGLIK
jgi:hypothetical protein